MKSFWELTIRVDKQLVNRLHYPSKKKAMSGLERFIFQGLDIFAPNKKMPLQFSYSLIRREK